jgi:hypothetical protein
MGGEDDRRSCSGGPYDSNARYPMEIGGELKEESIKE